MWSSALVAVGGDHRAQPKVLDQRWRSLWMRWASFPYELRKVVHLPESQRPARAVVPSPRCAAGTTVSLPGDHASPRGPGPHQSGNAYIWERLELSVGSHEPRDRVEEGVQEDHGEAEHGGHDKSCADAPVEEVLVVLAVSSGGPGLDADAYKVKHPEGSREDGGRDGQRV